MSYHSCMVNPSKPQMKSLKSGAGIKLSNKNMSGSHELFLTKAQLGRLEKAGAAGKGIAVKLSKTQLNHHRKRGAGWFDTLKSVVSNPIVQDIGRWGVNKAITKFGGSLDKIGAQVRKKHGEGAYNKLQHHIHGSGWFDTFKDIISNPIVQDLGQFAVKKGISMLGGKIRKVAKKKAGSFRGGKC